jgi:SpoVK/Ycf46/Vps4 family AAA+-type ATPase
VAKEHFIKALEKISPSITREMLDYYKNFEKAVNTI